MTNNISLPKVPTGIQGLDELTEGGIPKGRTSLVCGGPGCGKTLFGLEFIVHGASQFGERGVFVAFEETAAELVQNVASLGFDLNDLVARGQLVLDYVHVERSELTEGGAYDLDGLFIRLGYAIDSIGAKRVVLDTLEALFSDLADHGILRAELRRLFRWLKDKGVTSIVTAERGQGALTRYGLEEYVADCVILLDYRIIDRISTRSLRIVKYRGTTHGTNEYPFMIDHKGLSVLPITSLGLAHEALNDFVSSGVAGLDEMLGGPGYYRGSTILVSGMAGTGKSSLAATFVDAACRRGERCLYLAFEESPSQIFRNMRSIGIDVEPHVKSGLLHIQAGRPSVFGLERHLVNMVDAIDAANPSIVVLDPITDFTTVGNLSDVKAMLSRLIDLLKMRSITALFTSLTTESQTPEQSEVGISSLIDTWLFLRARETEGARLRELYILKSRGMAHSNQVREYWLRVSGFVLADSHPVRRAATKTSPHRDAHARPGSAVQKPARRRR